MSDTEAFLSTVEKFIATRGMNPTQFGKDFAGDPRFVFDLRKGREPRSGTRRRVLDAIGAAPAPTDETTTEVAA